MLVPLVLCLLAQTGPKPPVVTLTAPSGGWTVDRMLKVEGTVSDASVNPVTVSINGDRYLMRTFNGRFSREFPASDQAAWNREYQENVRTPLPELPFDRSDPSADARFDSRLWGEMDDRDWSALDDPFLLREDF